MLHRLKAEASGDVLPGMNAGASPYAVPSPIEGSGTAWVLLGSWALSPARPTPIHPAGVERSLAAPPSLQTGRETFASSGFPEREMVL